MLSVILRWQNITTGNCDFIATARAAIDPWVGSGYSRGMKEIEGIMV